MQASEDLLRSAQIQAPFLQRALTLGRVTGNAHLLIVDTFNQGVNSTTPAGVLANAQVQRAGAEVQAHYRWSQCWHDRDALALYRTRSRCNEMLGVIPEAHQDQSCAGVTALKA
jgi:hypothetical protein